MPETVATIRVTLPDGSVRDVSAGSTPKDVAAGIGHSNLPPDRL